MEREFLDITIEDVTPVMGVEVSMASPHLSVDVEDITPRLMVECEQVYEVEGETAPYTEIEYIESTGTQWIDTGYAFNDDFSWEIDFEGITLNKTVFGGRTSTNRTALLYQYNANNTTTCPIGSSNGQKTPFQLGNLSKGRHTVKMSVSASKGSVWVDGVQKYNNTSFAGAYISGTTQAIFADNFGGGDIQEFTNSKVYGLKMWQGTTLVRDFIPVLDKENIPCMYDKVSGEYFYNQGTNNFLYGLK